jgi:hypothetical protein
MKPTAELPEDAALPALDAIRSVGLAGAIPALGLEGCPVELLLRRYHRGVRAAFEARVGERRLAVKAYAEDPSPEAQLYEALAAAGLSNDSGFRVPPLLACDRDLRLLVTGWLEGPTAEQLIESGQGKAAGELVARWFQRAASMTLKLGPPLDAAGMLRHTRKWVATLAATDRALGTAGTVLLEALERTKPKDGAPRLLHGSFYPRHVIDLGDGVGVFDWERFGQGPAELDAGEFLATTCRIGVSHEPLAAEAARAAEAFLAGTAGLLDERATAWYRAVSLVRLANKRTRRPGDNPVLGQPLLAEAARVAESAC